MARRSDTPVLIGVAGGSGSGKTTVVRRIVDAIGAGDVIVLHHDSYYRDGAHLPMEERVRINYDHPDSLETELLIAHLESLLEGKAVEVPVYDFARHVRRSETRSVEPRPVIILDGILILWEERERTRARMGTWTTGCDRARPSRPGCGGRSFAR